jgi:hypothetical protein
MFRSTVISRIVLQEASDVYTACLVPLSAPRSVCSSRDRASGMVDINNKLSIEEQDNV